MAELKLLEFKYSADYKAVFEDIATLMFCIDLKLSRGVNRRINQKAIEADPVLIKGKSYAYQAKYYDESTKLYQHKKDLIESVKGASEENVSDLYLFINKNMPDKNHKTGEEWQYIRDIEDTAKNYNITLHWWPKSMIESSLDLDSFRCIRELFFKDNDDNEPNYSDFYSYVYRRFSETPKSKLFGNISLQHSYIELSIKVNRKIQTVHEYLETWVEGEEKIAVICGEPGHGKTSLCYKAMCDFYKNGWLSGKVSNVFCFSLNPAMTGAIVNESFNRYALLSWGNNRKNKKYILDETDCKDALVFFDGFDELIEWYPKFNLKYFIESEIVPFQEETGAHIIITSRNMAVDPCADYYSLQDSTSIPIQRLQLITEKQQLIWIGRYIKYCRKASAQKAKELEGYLDSYKHLEDRTDLKEILGIPIIFRLIVDTQYLPTTEKSIVQIYDKLFHANWIKHRRKRGTEEDEARTKEELQNHALRIFVDNNDTAETDISNLSSWLFSFYTTHDGKKRVGFLHRSFYQYFLAHAILGWYIEAADSDSEELIAGFRENLSYLAWRRLDRATLSYIKELYEYSEDRENIILAFEKAYNILKKTDGLIQGSIGRVNTEKEEKGISLDRANNIFWNIISIGSICGVIITPAHVNMHALRLYELNECILSNAHFGKSEIGCINLSFAKLSGANLSKADLSGANLSRADLSGADLNGANLREADLCGADLKGAKLNGADLSGANLSIADLSGADLKEVNFSGADLFRAKLSGANLSGAVLNRAKLISAYLFRANLKGAKLKGACLNGAKLIGANLVEANLSGADLNGTNLSRADCTGATLTGAFLRGADFSKVIIDSRNASELVYRGYGYSGMIITMKTSLGKDN